MTTKNIQDVVAGINGHRIIDKDETIKVYQGEIVLPLSELTHLVKEVEAGEREKRKNVALILKKNGLQVEDASYPFFKIENKHWFEALEALTPTSDVIEK